MEISILGSLEAREGTRILDLGGGKQRALLANLAIHRGQLLGPDRLIDDLWGDRPPPSAAKTLQVLISRLRKTLGRETIVTRGGGYMLAADGVVTDVEQLEDLLRTARDAATSGDATAAAEHTAAAAGLFRARPLTDFAFDDFAQLEIARLEELHLFVLEQRIEHELAAGRGAELIPELEALVREHPLREPLRAQLMLALYRAGRQADALEAYHSARTTLVGELGIEPGRALRELEQAILQQDVSLDADGAVPTAGDPPDAGGSFLVGREHELAQLHSGLDRAFAGHGSLFLLVGEPGIGKSRVAEELLREARKRGAVALAGRCWEAGGAPAYWPWVQSLRAYVERTERSDLRAQLGNSAGDIAQMLPELRELAPDAPAPSVDSEGARFRLFDATARFLKAAAATQPIVLVLDDLHAADEPSLLLLRFLAAELGGSRVLVIGTYRNVDPTVREPLTSTLAELARERVTSRIELRGLGESDIRRYIELNAKTAPPRELVEAIHRETEGNPLFVGEVVRLLAAEGSLEDLKVESLWTFGIPQGVREVIGRRLSRLSPRCTQMLTLASVLGREFRLDALERVGGGHDDLLLESLDEAVGARVLAPTPGSRGTLRFAHALIRETLYDGLTTVRRVQLHRAAGDALEQLYGEHPDAHLAELAYHFFEAAPGGDAEKAVAYARQAAERALTLLAYEEAARLVRTALEALDFVQPQDKRASCELLVTLGEAESRAGNMQIAKDVLWRAAELARIHHLPRELARAAAVYGGRIVYARAGSDDRIVPLLEEALGALGEDEVKLRARLLARLAGALRDEHSRLRRDRLSAEAVALARSSGDAGTLAYALDGRIAAYIGPDRLDAILALTGELRELAEATSDHEPLLSARFFRFICFVTRCVTPDADTELEVVVEMAQKLHQPAQLCQVTASRAMLALGRGEFESGKALAEEAFRYGVNAAPEIAVPAMQLHSYALGVALGEMDELVPNLRAIAETYPARPFFRSALVHVQALLGDVEAERGFAELASDGFARLPLDTEWLYAMSLLAETSVLLHDLDRAEQLYRLLTPYAQLNVVNVPEGVRGSVSRYLGLLAAMCERWDDAATHFSCALETNERLGLRPWVAATQEDLARMLLASNREGPRVDQLLDAAIGTYRTLGMRPHAERAAALA
jgi:eukaryotic-like serine/threonine-protein kinase